MEERENVLLSIEASEDKASALDAVFRYHGRG
jgi:hypothetical protein